MLYTLNDLLAKMGAPEVKERGRMGWRYFDQETREIAGFAEIGLTDGGGRLIAKLEHTRRDHEDDAGETHSSYVERFYLHAERQGTQYKVIRIAFDGEEYVRPQKAIIELGLSIFYARALDISILMMEQTFNKQDILDPSRKTISARTLFSSGVKSGFRAESRGKVIPFPTQLAARRL